jgi:hypothetical protein
MKRTIVAVFSALLSGVVVAMVVLAVEAPPAAQAAGGAT